MTDEDRARAQIEDSRPEEFLSVRHTRQYPKRAHPRINGDPSRHPRSSVCLTVAAEFLGMDERTVRARIDNGDIKAIVDGRIYRIDLQDLIAYDARRRIAS